MCMHGEYFPVSFICIVAIAETTLCQIRIFCSVTLSNLVVIGFVFPLHAYKEFPVLLAGLSDRICRIEYRMFLCVCTL